MQNYFSIQVLWVVKSLWLTSKKIPLSMRLLVLFLVCSIGLTYAADSYAQKAMISIDAHNQRVEDVLKEIEEQSDFDFFFNNKHVDLNRRVSVSADKSNIFSVLEEIFAGTNVKYSVLDKKIVLSVEKQSPQQEKKVTVSGTVTDAQGEPVIGASVLEKGVQGSGTITDIDGRFKLSVSSAKTQLEVSYIGYRTQILAVQIGKDIRIILQEDSKQLDEVVVVGYGTQTKKSLTGAVGTMNMEDIETSTVTSVSHTMGGKVAGLRANIQSAQPGGAAKFRIRGEASVGAGNEPLIVIDGFPVSSSSSLGSGNVYNAGDTDNVLESLNPDDIESISVLKDAASTAIYGARAGHGVILITTKRGKSGKPKVTYSASGSFQNIRADYDMLSAKEYMEVQNMQLKERWLRTYGMGIYEGYIHNDNEPTPFTPKYSDEQIRNAAGTDWLDEVTRTGYMQQHNVSINGGGETTKYMASINYMDQKGVVKNNGTTRFSARLNLDQVINKYVSVGLTASYSQNRYDNVPLGDGDNENAGILTSAIRFNPTLPIYDENGEYTIDPGRSTFPNPVSLLDITDNTVKDRLMGQAFVIIKPIKGLELKGMLGADRRIQKRRNYLPKTTLSGAEQNGIANVSYEDATDYLMDLTATYNANFKEHSLKALVGYSYQQFNAESVNAGNSDFLIDSFLYHNLAAGNWAKPTVGSGASKNSLGSYFARINYQFQNKYLLEATVRADGAANFAKENRWGFFPSVSAGWVVTEEKFMSSTRNWLSNLKLRASFGQTGNSSIGNRINTFYNTGDKNHNYLFGGSLMNGVYASELGNPNLTWETTTEFNIGIDLGFLNDRIRLTAEYFKRRITDMLVTKPLLFYNEVTSIADNAGSTQSQGFELTLNTVNISTRNFEWNTTLTLSKYNDRWLERADTWKPASYEKENDPIRAWWDYRALGILKPGEKAPTAQPDLLPGQVILEDKDHNGVINNDDKYFMDNGDPKIIYGFNNSLRYKHFDFNIYFYGEAGRKRGASYYENWIDTNENSQNLSTYVYKSFSSENPTSNNPSILKNSNGTIGDFYLKSIYYIRCGHMTLGYNVPVNKKWISNLRVYANVDNPFVITNWTGLDPETDTNTYSYPNVTSYSLGLNITF
ncbi:TonB-dependent receptor [uncultured Bacteroides sp.]|uniref:TonB-dependent receptor n=1 Tax=uncultured Bacteroides sp. TaxID=162156 RepID=UPI0025EAECCA|nr:TonB-dependent receptor [uncultured Bacteroides sp.]